MPNTETKALWKKFLADRGVEKKLIEQYLPYIFKLIDNKVPVILELEHLSLLLGIKYQELTKIINSPSSFYREFTIPKRLGGTRRIQSPYPSLLYCQEWIYKNILIKNPLHDCAHGYALNRSILSNAKPHLNQKILLKMDLECFFESIPINWVINYFANLGYAKNISFYLASICCLNSSLPQGAATSPALSNILLYQLDNRLNLLSQTYQINYTRYADDLTFSGNYIPHNFIQIVNGIIESYELKVNTKKTRLHTKKGKRIVTGVSVSGSTPTIPRSTKRELRKEIFYIKKFGYLSHVTKLKIRKINYLNSLEGKFQFWNQVEPGNKFVIASIEYIKEIKNS